MSSINQINKCAAIFDIDGTLIKGFIICDFPKFLSKNGFFDSDANKKIQDVLLKYVQGQISTSSAADEIPKQYALGLKGQNRDNIITSATSFMNEYKKNISPYAKQLIELMNKKKFMTIATSGSPIEVIKKLHFLGIQKFYGSEMHTINGLYTGKIKENMVSIEGKLKIFNNMIKEQNINLKDSYAFGDTEQDIPMLSSVGHPFAINPDKKLRDVAENNGWQIGDLKTVFTHIIKEFESYENAKN